MFCFSNQINLHQQQCPKKAVECPVTGCRRIMLKEDYNRHVCEAAGSHYNLQSAEIQRLRRTIHDKVNKGSIFLLVYYCQWSIF